LQVEIAALPAVVRNDITFPLFTLCSNFLYYTGQTLSLRGERGVGVEKYSLSLLPLERK